MLIAASDRGPFFRDPIYLKVRYEVSSFYFFGLCLF